MQTYWKFTELRSYVARNLQWVSWICRPLMFASGSLLTKYSSLNDVLTVLIPSSWKAEALKLREVPYETSRAKECPKTRPLGGVKGDVQRQLGHHSKGNLRKQDVLKNIDGHPESHKHWEEAVMRPTLLQGPIKYRSSAITLSRRQIAPLWMTPKTSQEFADEPRSHQVIRSESDGVGVPGH